MRGSALLPRFAHEDSYLPFLKGLRRHTQRSFTYASSHPSWKPRRFPAPQILRDWLLLLRAPTYSATSLYDSR